jgi:hypothetical protein
MGHQLKEDTMIAVDILIAQVRKPTMTLDIYRVPGDFDGETYRMEQYWGGEYANLEPAIHHNLTAEQVIISLAGLATGG